MSTVYRLCELSLWPLAPTPDGKAMHFGLHSVTIIRTTYEGGEPKVCCRKIDLFRELDEDARDMLEHFEISPLDAKVLASVGKKGLTVQHMILVMQAASRMLKSITPKIGEMPYYIGLNVSFDGAYCKQPVEKLTDLRQFVGSNPFVRCPDKDEIKRISGALLHKPKITGPSVPELSCLPVFEYTDEKDKDDVAKLIQSYFDKQGSYRANCYAWVRKGYSDAKYVKSYVRDGKIISACKPEKMLIACAVPFFMCGARKSTTSFLGQDMHLYYNAYANLYYNALTGACTWEHTYARELVVDGVSNAPESLMLKDIYALPLIAHMACLTGLFGNKIPSLSHLQTHFEFANAKNLERFGVSLGLKGTPVSMEQACIINSHARHLLHPEDTALEEQLNKYYVTTDEIREWLNVDIPNEYKNETKVSENVAQARDKSTTSGNTCDLLGNELTEGDITFEFHAVVMPSGAKGCKVEIKHISPDAAVAGIVVNVPKEGLINGKSTPVVSVGHDFCREELAGMIRGVIMPETLIQLEYTSAGGAFTGFRSLEFVDMSACKKLKLIGRDSFKDCRKLHDVKLPDIPVKDSYSIYDGAFWGIPSLGSLTIRAKEILNNAFVDTHIYELDIDAEHVKNHAFSKDAIVEGSIKMGTSFVEIAPSGMSGIFDRLSKIEVNLPNITTLGDYALGRMTRGGKITLGENINAIGLQALSGWDTVIVKGKAVKNVKSALASGAFANIGDITVHASTPYEVEALRSVNFFHVHYFEGEKLSDYRKSAEDYLAMATLFIAKKEQSSLSPYLKSCEELAEITYADVEENPETVENLLTGVATISPNIETLFAPILNGEDTAPADADADPNFIRKFDVSYVKMLMALNTPLSDGIAEMYSATKRYVKLFLPTLVYDSPNIKINRAKLITPDFNTNVFVYSLYVRSSKQTYLFVEKTPDVQLVGVDEVIIDALGFSESDAGRGKEEYRYRDVPAFVDANLTSSMPFLVPGDALRLPSPTLMAESFKGKGNIYKYYIRSLLANSVLLKSGTTYLSYNELNAWLVTFDNKDIVRVRERIVNYDFDSVCNRFKGDKIAKPTMITDAKVFADCAKAAEYPSPMGTSPLEAIVTEYKGFVDQLSKANDKDTLPFTKDLFDKIKNGAPYAMSEHSNSGLLAGENSLMSSKGMRTRRKLADGNYLQCYISSRISKGTSLKLSDFADGNKMAMRGGKYMTWYKVFAGKDDKEPIATYISPYPLDLLEEHLNRFSFDEKDKAPAIECGNYAPLGRFVFDSETMPVYYDGLTYNKGAVARICCGIDAYTGKWYLMANDVAAKAKGAKSGKRTYTTNYVPLFPITNMAFVSATVLGLKGATYLEDTANYLKNLLLAVKGVNTNSRAYTDYLEVSSTLASAKPDRQIIADKTDFFLAPCIG